jgi:hypothetical protein
MADFTVGYTSGFTQYALIFDPAERAWNGVGFVDPTGVRPTCAVAMVDNGNDTYTGTVPSSVPTGTYAVRSYLQLGATPADDDPITGGAAVPVTGNATTFESALVARLKANPAITAIVGTRIYPLAIPQKGQLPALVYAIPSTDRVRNLAGAAGVAVARVLIDARATTYAVVKSLQELLRQYDGFDGVLAGDVIVLNTRMEDQGDEFEWPGGTGTDVGTHHLTLTFNFKYRESLPVAP